MGGFTDLPRRQPDVRGAVPDRELVDGPARPRQSHVVILVRNILGPVTTREYGPVSIRNKVRSQLNKSPPQGRGRWAARVARQARRGRAARRWPVESPALDWTFTPDCRLGLGSRRLAHCEDFILARTVEDRILCRPAGGHIMGRVRARVGVRVVRAGELEGA